MTIKNILYAEDNPDDVMILKIAFRRAGISASLNCVDDGEDAIAWLKGEGAHAEREQYPRPDVLILDLKMPKKSGFDVLEWLRSSDNFKDLPAIILSSSDDPRDLERASKLGATKYFKKTATCQEVIQYLQSLPGAHS
jgi:CheY-like chemotaxis protein